MIVETNASATPVVTATKEPKVNRIESYNKITIIVNAVLLACSLLIGWALWLTTARQAIDNYLKWFNNPTQPNANLQISFQTISIIVLIFSILSLVLIVMPFIFIKNKNSISALFSFITFIFAAIFVVFLTVFFIFRFETFAFLANKTDGEITNTTGNFLIAFLPWILAQLFAVLLLIHSLWLTINITAQYKSNILLMPVAKPKANTNQIIKKEEIDDTITIPGGVPIPTSNITSTNMEAPSSKEVATTNNSNNNHVNYTNNDLSSQSTPSAYHDEAVPPTPDTITNLQPEHNNSEAATNAIYSRPVTSTVSSEQSKYDDLPPTNTTDILELDTSTTNNTTTDTIYQPKNQGGFDVQDDNQTTTTITNVKQQPAKTTTAKAEIIVNQPPTPKVTKQHWTLAQIEAVWEKAEAITGVSDKLYRKDYAGAWMFRDSFTNDYTTADNIETYSWTIVLHRPANQQGTTELHNLDPMNIVNAKSKGDNYPSWKTKISSKANKNIAKEQNWKART